MAQNKAAWYTDKGVLPFKVDDAPYPQPGEGELVIKAAAVAVNPGEFPLCDGVYEASY